MAMLVARCANGGIHAVSFRPAAADLRAFADLVDEGLAVTLEPQARITPLGCGHKAGFGLETPRKKPIWLRLAN